MYEYNLVEHNICLHMFNHLLHLNNYFNPYEYCLPVEFVMDSLISEVHKRKILRNRFYKQFKDRVKVDNKWGAVAKELRLPSKYYKK